MKTCTITAAIAVIVGISSAHAAKPSRRRTQTAHKSARVDESYDPYLGMGERRLEGHTDTVDGEADHDGEDMMESMPEGTVTTMPDGTESVPTFDEWMSTSMPDGTAPPPTPGTDEVDTSPTPGDSNPSPTDKPDGTEKSSASSVGTTVSALVAAGAMMLL